MFDLQDVLLVDSVHICNGTVFERGVELYGHAETAEDHVSIAVLAAKCLVGDFKTRGAVDCPINPGHLQTTDTLVHVVPNRFDSSYSLLYGCGPWAH